MSQDFGHLMDDFGFTNAELQANRQGRLTERQLDDLKQRQRTQLYLGGIVGAGFIFLLVFVFPPSHAFFLFAIVALVFAAGLYGVFNLYRELDADIRSGAVDHISGKPYLYSSPARGGRSYSMSINGKVFYLHKEQYLALDNYVRSVNPSSLTVYFTPTANVLLSMEE